MHRFHIALAVSACLLGAAAIASAHVAITSGPAFAGGRAVLDFGVGHGCAGADTVSIDVHIPAEVTSVRGAPNSFGSAVVVRDATDAPTNVVWTKAEALAGDDQYYTMQVRIGVPDAPFTTLHFPVTQVCRDSEGTETTVEWIAETEDSEESPAAALVILPERKAGWNMYTVPTAVTELETYFGDAQIVWAGDAAYSANEATAQMIEDEDGVDTLTEIAAGTEIWVKY